MSKNEMSSRRKSRHWTILLGILTILAVFAAFAINSTQGVRLMFPRAFSVVGALPKAAAFTAGQRVLIVSPHPDDETLCCAGMIQQAKEAGASVHIVWLTNGDAFKIDAMLLDRSPRPSGAQMRGLGELRMNEAQAAARVLGLPQDHLYFLGYPDRGLLHMFLENYNIPYRSTSTKVARVPYKGVVQPNAAYTGQNVQEDLAKIIDKVRPDILLVPSPQDHHPDHRAAGYFTARIASGRGELDRLRYWIVHGGLEWPLPKGLHITLPLIIPPTGRHLAWERVDLTPEERDRKLDAIKAHVSQMDVMARYLTSFVRENELVTQQILPHGDTEVAGLEWSE